MTRMSQDLAEKLHIIERVFGKNLSAIQTDASYIQEYYRVNRLAYSLFHSRSNFVHMGISRTGTYRKEDLSESTRIVGSVITDTHAKNVLELATGRGANSAWLAKRHPATSFTGVDLSPAQLRYAEREASRATNITIKDADFHDLSQFADSSFDLVFVIEALCYSQTKDVVVGEVSRILRPGGHFIIIDGYLGERTLTPDETVAARLTALGMAVEDFEPYQRLTNTLQSSRFKIVHEEDVSPYVIPTMMRFERLARLFFLQLWLARVTTHVLPEKFLYNAVSGWLMPELFREQVFKYWVTISKKT